MTVRLLEHGVIELQGECPSEDAEVLLRHLLADPNASVDWNACTAAHSAVIQVLMAARPAMQGTPRGQALRDWVQPLLLL